MPSALLPIHLRTQASIRFTEHNPRSISRILASLLPFQLKALLVPLLATVLSTLFVKLTVVVRE